MRFLSNDSAGTSGSATSGWRLALLIALTLALAVLALQKAAGAAFARSAPQLALKLAPNNAVALATSADTFFTDDPAGNVLRVEHLARRSLRRQGINGPALRLLGFVADIRRQSAAARLVMLSTQMSRRDTKAQLWLIEEAVRTNDVPGALRHYDIALRTSKSTGEILYPILTGALDERAVRVALAPYLKQRPFWIQAFLGHAIAFSAHPENVARALFDVDGALADPHNGEINVRLVERLVATGQVEAAKQVYLATPGSSSARLVSPALSERDRTGRDGALGWRLASTTAGAATIDAGDSSAAFVLHAEMAAGNNGRVAEKVLFLSPGRYRFAAHVAGSGLGEGMSDQRPSGENGSSTPGLRWHLVCMIGPAGTTPWTLDGGIGSVAAAFSVPAGCAMQRLTIDMAAGDGTAGASADITGIMVDHW